MEHTKDRIKQKEKPVFQLMEEISGTEDLNDKASRIADLVHHFKDERIFPFLQDMLQDDKLEAIHGFLIDSCAACSLDKCRTSMPFFIDLLANGTYEAAMGAAQLLLRLMDTYKPEASTLGHLQKKLTYYLSPTVQNAALKYDLEK